jgi:hypothetical protein
MLIVTSSDSYNEDEVGCMEECSCFSNFFMNITVPSPVQTQNVRILHSKKQHVVSRPRGYSYRIVCMQ